MIVTTTEVQNNFGKHLKLALEEEIIITRNGKKIAKLVKYEGGKEIKETEVKEGAVSYGYDGMKVSYEEFKKISEASDSRYEYIDGRIYLLASPVVNHQRIIRNILVKLDSWFDNQACEPFTSPFDVTLYRGEKEEKNINIVQPDILVICDQENINKDDRYMGIPDLVIEVLSKTNKNHDFIRKLDLYRTTGIKEYWIVNPFSKEIGVYTFSEKNIEEIISFKKKEKINSAVFEGLQISLSDIFEHPAGH